MTLRQFTISTAIVSLALAIPFVAYGQTSNWTGAVDSSWNNAGNWDNGVPNTASEIAVVGAPSPTLSDVNVTLGGLTVLSDGVLNLNAGRQINFDPTATIVNEGTIDLVGGNIDFQLVNTVTNNGVITVNASGANSELELLTNATLDGAGEVILAGAGAGINDSGGLQQLTNAGGHTIRGEGNIGRSTINLVNEGLIVADVAAGTLFLDPNGNNGTLDNNATLRSIGGAVLAFNGGVYNNAGGSIESSGGQIRFNTFAQINGGTISGADIAVSAGAAVDFTDVTLNGSIVTENGSDLITAGTITNNGTVTVGSGANGTDISLQAPTTFAGTGSLVLQGANARINDTGGLQQLTNAAGHTIRGEGNIGVSTIDLVNNGLIVADVAAATLALDPNGNNGTLDNGGTLRSIGGAVLAFNGGVYNNASGSIESAGGQVRFNALAQINGGTISGADIAVSAGADATFTDVTIDGSVIAENGAGFVTAGTITNNGTITIAAGANATDVTLDSATTFTGNGTLVLDGPNARISDFTGVQPLTNAAGHTIRGDGGNIGVNTVSIVNNGLIVADSDSNGAPLTIDPFGGSTSSTFSGSGVIRAVNGGDVFLEPAAYDFDEGLFEAIGAGSTIDRSTSVFNVFFGSIRAIDGGSVRIFDQGPDGALTFDGDVGFNSDLIELRGTTSNTDIFDNTGQIPTDTLPLPGVPSSGDGFSGSNRFAFNEGEFILGDGYDFRSGSFLYGDFTNTGTILAEAGSDFSAGGYDTITITNGSASITQATMSRSFINTGTLAGSGTFANSNTLFGTGINPVAVGFAEGDFIESDGILAPGDSETETGTMTLHARDILLGDSNDIQIDIGATGFDTIDFITEPTTGSPGQPDTINTVELNGELSVTLVDGFTPSPGDTFTILTADDGFIGAFDTETLPVIGDCLVWQVNYNPTTVELQVVLPGDFNGDGFVDNNDLNLLLGNWGSTTVPPEWVNGFEGPQVDNGELNNLLGKWGFGLGVITAVPEPATGVLLVLASAFGVIRRRRELGV